MVFVLSALGGVVLFAVIWTLSHANEMFCLSCRGGRTLVVRGVVPASLRTELAAVVGAREATIIAVRENRAARLKVFGVDESTGQRLRNVFGTSRYAELKSLGARPSGTRNLGQRLGWIWLAWKLEG